MAKLNFIIRAFTPAQLLILNDVLNRENKAAEDAGKKLPDTFKDLIDNVKLAAQYVKNDRT